MLRIFFGFLTGAVYGIMYMAGEPSGIIVNSALLIKSVIRSVLGI